MERRERNFGFPIRKLVVPNIWEIGQSLQPSSHLVKKKKRERESER